MSMDGLDTLAVQVYGRTAKPGEWLGGSDAKILWAAARLIQGLMQDQKASRNREEQLALRIDRALGMASLCALTGRSCDDMIGEETARRGEVKCCAVCAMRAALLGAEAGEGDQL